MRTIKDLAKKDLAAIMYVYYLEEICEDDFSFDKGKARKQIENHFKSLNLSDEEHNTIVSNIVTSMEEGTDF